MNFKELLKRYQEGSATEEERQIVEKELDKYRSIEDYLSENLSDRFFEKDGEIPDEEEANEKSAEDEDETNSIQKVVNRRLAKVVLTSVLIVVLLYVGIFHGVSAVVDSMYYDPASTTNVEGEEYPALDIEFDLRAYTSLNMPGYVTSFASIDSKGFGEYEVHYPLRNLFTRDSQRHFVNLTRGRVTYVVDGIFDWENRSGLWDGFDEIRYPIPEYVDDAAHEGREHEIQRKNEKTLRYLNELNPLSYLSMHIVFEEDLTMHEFYQLSREHRSLDFKWVGVRTTEPGSRWGENQPMHLIGFNPNFNDEPSSNRRPDPEEFPFFNLIDMTELPIRFEEEFSEAYETHFRSRLTYLVDREEFIEIFDYNKYKLDFYNEALEFIDEHGVKTYGVLVYGKAEDFNEAIDDLPYHTIYSDDVLPAKPNIYY